MHIPNSMLEGSICPVSALISTSGVIFAGWKGFVAKLRPSAMRFGAVTALIFALQMINFPINGGTSGHLIGGVLAVALLGIPFGILSMALVVAIQCLVFADGGFLVLGANIFNMALIGAGLGGIILKHIRQKVSSDSYRHSLGLGVASWFSVIAAAFFCSLELGISGTISFSTVLPAMLGTHALIGVGEGLITIAVYYALAFNPIKASDRRSASVPLLVAGMVAFVLSPFASGLPDGLEWVAQKYQFFHQSAPTFVSPLPDYAVPAVSHEIFTTALAGLLGVIVTFLIGWIIAKLLKKPGEVA
ncbi:MAG: energy-coupling factor ABC transporter permease [Candidatus Omnitrophica bacterium]|nr:energy-coupling factor ABC transporter permease [Candidatus Omnitrophota bacterium]